MDITAIPWCRHCLVKDGRTIADGKCQECEENMCNKCFQLHLDSELCSHHMLVQIQHEIQSGSDEYTEPHEELEKKANTVETAGSGTETSPAPEVTKSAFDFWKRQQHKTDGFAPGFHNSKVDIDGGQIPGNRSWNPSNKFTYGLPQDGFAPGFHNSKVDIDGGQVPGNRSWNPSNKFTYGLPQESPAKIIPRRQPTRHAEFPTRTVSTKEEFAPGFDNSEVSIDKDNKPVNRNWNPSNKFTYGVPKEGIAPGFDNSDVNIDKDKKPVNRNWNPSNKFTYGVPKEGIAPGFDNSDVNIDKDKKPVNRNRNPSNKFTYGVPKEGFPFGFGKSEVDTDEVQIPVKKSGNPTSFKPTYGPSTDGFPFGFGKSEVDTDEVQNPRKSSGNPPSLKPTDGPSTGSSDETRSDQREENHNSKTIQREREQVDSYIKEIHQNGVIGVKKKLRNDLDNWTTTEIHIAVTGNSGTGKSSFVNSVRGLTPKDPGAAKVGVIETTMECVAYKHPKNEKFFVWDLPGVGTPAFPRDDYLDKVSYDKYDFFIILSRTRFTENDIWLALEVQRQKKKFFFVRTNIDQDIENNKADNQEDHDEQKLLDVIRTKTENELRKIGVEVPMVFLISNRATDKFDFGRLNDELLASSNGLKKDAMALTLVKATQQVIQEKKRVLEGRIHMVAFDVASSRDKSDQKSVFKDEINFYLQQFNIDDDAFDANKEILSLSDTVIEKYKIDFDEQVSGNGIQFETPTAMRQKVKTWDRLKDWFKTSTKDKLLYYICTETLKRNLDELHYIASVFYNRKTAAQIVNAIAK